MGRQNTTQNRRMSMWRGDFLRPCGVVAIRGEDMHVGEAFTHDDDDGDGDDDGDDDDDDGDDACVLKLFCDQ